MLALQPAIGYIYKKQIVFIEEISSLGGGIESMREFLVIQALRFGDLIQTKRLVLSLAERGHVHLLVAQPLVSLARLIYPQVTVHGLHFQGTTLDKDGIEKNRSMFQLLRTLDVQQVFNCNRTGLTEAVCRLFPSEIVIGHRPHGTATGGCLRSPLVRLHASQMKNRGSSCLNIVDYWANFVSDPISPGRVNPDAKSGGQGIGVVVAGSLARRSMPALMLAELIKIFIGIFNGCPIYLLGTLAEQTIAQKILHALPTKLHGNIRDLTGKTDWKSLCDVLSGLDILLTPDTGTMHLACHLGVPVRAFFLSSALCHETGPYGKGHLVWQSQPECAPCLEASPCAHDMTCLHSFDDPLFLRSVAKCARQIVKDVVLPANIQLWQSMHDSLGCYYHLKSGSDRMISERAAKRLAMSQFLHNPLRAVPHLGVLEGETRNDLEWMLPPGRYC